MSYELEQLGDERFQQLCQAILAAKYKNVQCFPINQPDGGRDGFRKIHNPSPDSIIYQVKFSKSGKARDVTDFVSSVITSERSKVLRLAAKGATQYVLMTNVEGTGHLENGSIDKVNKLLSDSFGISVFCWWRDEICRHIDSNPELKWTYGEIITGRDVISVLMHISGHADAARHALIIKSYVAHQARADKNVRFKQVDLNSDLLGLFTDIPAKLDAVGPKKKAEIIDAGGNIHELLQHAMQANLGGTEHELECPGALSILAHNEFSNIFPQVVVEGAPGQGKSTVTQYLCQVHRLNLLRETDELARVPENYVPKSIRIPFRIDLRDYASWLNGKDPFGDETDAARLAKLNPILESFIVAQVGRLTGMAFTVTDLAQLTQKSQILIVLDGFDEVADVPTRNRIISEVSDAASRLRTMAISLQIIVTSRPSAFANSPGFPKGEWQHLQLLSLTHPIILEYASRWLDARSSEPREKADVLRTLNEKLELSHVRELARNPMQLAILLALVIVQGVSLPDRRTSLYDRYIDIFMNRESEKSRIVRVHRELLINIHMYLGWVLHTQAERSGAGQLDAGELRDLIRSYLNTCGHSTEMVDDLFSGLVERVVALVSRVQGTFEFEVQPLREYFAARYLHNSAPYCPGTEQRAGTLPDRFDTLARNFYWLNVTRFYAGCYSAGELASLADGLESIDRDHDFALIAHSSTLGVVLLDDYVFSQQPRLAIRLAQFITHESRFKLWLARSHWSPGGPTGTIPAGPARNILDERCRNVIIQANRYDMVASTAELLSDSVPPERRLELWNSVSANYAWADWLQLGIGLKVFGHLPIQRRLELAKQNTDVNSSYFRSELMGLASVDSSAYDCAMLFLLDSSSVFPLSHRLTGKDLESSLLLWLSLLNSLPVVTQLAKPDDSDTTLRDFLFSGPFSSLIDSDVRDIHPAGPVGFEDFCSCLRDLVGLSFKALSDDSDAWGKLISAGEAIWGRRWMFCLLSITAADMNNNVDEGYRDFSGSIFSDSESLLSRAIRMKRMARDSSWWSRQFNDRSAGAIDIQFVLLGVANWVPAGVVIEHASSFERLLNGLSEKEWMFLMSNIFGPFDSFLNLHKRPGRESKLKLPKNISHRLCAFILTLTRDESLYKVWLSCLGNYSGVDRGVLSVSLRVLLRECTRRNTVWEKFRSVVATSYRVGLPVPGRAYFAAGLKGPMPLTTAEIVCSNFDEYPLAFINLAQEAVGAAIGTRARAVGTESSKNGWEFAN